MNLTLDTDALANYALIAPPQTGASGRGIGGFLLASLLPLGMIGLLRRKRAQGLRNLTVYPLAILLAVVLTMLGGCSGKYPGHTPPGTYAIPITASGVGAGNTATTTHTVTITLNVTP